MGCWRAMSKLRRGDSHPCEVLQFNQCLHLQEVGFSLSFFVLSLWAAVGVGVGVGWWGGVLAWDYDVKAWRSSSM